MSTLVCEEHARIGDPVHCTGILATRELRHPRPAARRDAQHADDRAVRFAIGLRSSRTRRRRRWPPSSIAARSTARWPDAREAAGAEVRVGTRVSVVETGPTAVRALVGDDWVSARLLIMACGANYAFQRRFGLGLPRSYLHTAQRELRRAGMPATSSCTSAATSRPTALRGPCRSSASRARTSAWA